MAVIASELAWVATRPELRGCSDAQATATCKGERPTAVETEPRWVSPSMATGLAQAGPGTRASSRTGS